MSASEKLRALEVRIAEAEAYAAAAGWEGGSCCKMAGGIIEAHEALALPQLVAVVEAAERAEPVLIPGQRQNMHGGQMTPVTFAAMTPEEWYAILAALAALDEALA